MPSSRKINYKNVLKGTKLSKIEFLLIYYNVFILKNFIMTIKIDILFLLIDSYHFRLLWLNISHNEVPKMSARVFARVSVLRVLNLNSNKITSLDANSFRGMRFMRRLYFADNQISRVGRGAFKAVSRYVNNDILSEGLCNISKMHLTKVTKSY